MPDSPTPDELRALLRRTGLTGSQAAALLGVNPRTIRRWCGGERAMPDAAWFALRVKTGEHPDYPDPAD